MSIRRKDSPSLLKTVLVHTAMATVALGGVAGSGAAAIQLAGDPLKAGPSLEMAVFDDVDRPGDVELKTRFAERDAPGIQIASMIPASIAETPGERTLGVGYPQGAGEAAPAQVQPVAAEMPEGVRINGRTVFPGEAFSDVMTLGELPTSPLPGLHERTGNGYVPKIANDGREAADVYARPHISRPGQPSVSLVLGGLGINYAHTRSAIEELPPEVTLSFAPHARGLQTWVKRARDAGHEVLIELPLEPYEPGRVRPHANTLKAGADAGAITDNVERILALGHGFFGVINYQGDKFASDSDAAQDMFNALRSRGVSFIEDGSIPGAALQLAASEAGARYARADYVIDARIEADAMRAQLQALEADALANGSALGTAIGYPLTIDIIKEWTGRLEQNGVILAPASSLQAVPALPQPAPEIVQDVSVMDVSEDGAKLP